MMIHLHKHKLALCSILSSPIVSAGPCFFLLFDVWEKMGPGAAKREDKQAQEKKLRVISFLLLGWVSLRQRKGKLVITVSC